MSPFKVTGVQGLLTRMAKLLTGFNDLSAYTVGSGKNAERFFCKTPGFSIQDYTHFEPNTP